MLILTPAGSSWPRRRSGLARDRSVVGLGVTGGSSGPFQYAMRFEVDGCAGSALLVDVQRVDGILDGRVTSPGLPPADQRISELLRGLCRPATAAELAGELLTVKRLVMVIRGDRGPAPQV
jgi:hypothetical protein